MGYLAHFFFNYSHILTRRCHPMQGLNFSSELEHLQCFTIVSLSLPNEQKIKCHTMMCLLGRTSYSAPFYVAIFFTVSNSARATQANSSIMPKHYSTQLFNMIWPSGYHEEKPLQMIKGNLLAALSEETTEKPVWSFNVAIHLIETVLRKNKEEAN